MDSAIKRTFASFEVRNFRLYFFGQGLSLCGTWVQTIAISWLVLKLTHSGTQLGLVTAAQFLPILIFGVWGGIVADRFNKRHILYFTQTIYGVLALILGILVISHGVQLWMVYVIASCLGFVAVIDMPSRQTFVVEMVGKDRLKNALTLNSTVVNAARVIGPSIAGVLIATVGVGPCFIINAISYIAVLTALFLMRQSELVVTQRSERQARQIREGIKYVASMPVLKATLIMMFIIGTFAYEFPVILPLFSTVTLHGNATTYSILMAAQGFGAIFGGLYSAGRGAANERLLIRVALLFGVSIIVSSLMPSFVAVTVVMVFVGALSVLFISLGNTTLQLTSDPTMRGRVMSLWAIAFQGTTPIGGPIIGFIAQHANPRIALATGGTSAIVAAGIGFLLFSKKKTLIVQPERLN